MGVDHQQMDAEGIKAFDMKCIRNIQRESLNQKKTNEWVL